MVVLLRGRGSKQEEERDGEALFINIRSKQIPYLGATAYYIYYLIVLPRSQKLRVNPSEEVGAVCVDFESTGWFSYDRLRLEEGRGRYHT